MNNKNFISLILCLALIITGCSKDAPASQELTQSAQHSIQSGDASALTMFGPGTPIKGNSSYAEPSECDAASQGATYAVKLIGDLKGCIYAFVDFSNAQGMGSTGKKGENTSLARTMDRLVSSGRLTDS
jgi:hypothetical protein